MIVAEQSAVRNIVAALGFRCDRLSSEGLRSSVRVLLSATLFLIGGIATSVHAQGGTLIRIDASEQYTEPAAAEYDLGSATSPLGSTLGINSRYLTLNGRPWLPVMGEFHYSRYPESKWEEEILKMKAAGINTVAVYIIWIHHEEVEGQFDWKGQRNLRAFAQLCSKHGMYLEPRVGPWDHAEARNGGFPDWLLTKGPTRVNAPAYLSYVREWYGQIGQQLKGLMWKDGGPVIGIQLENEYSVRGPTAGEDHILQLKKIAVESGLDVPYYFVTGWDNAAVPVRAVLPVYGGYPDAPWDGSLKKMPPAEVYAFRFKSRVTANMGAIGGQRAAGTQTPRQALVPYLTAEMGGGIEDTYHRRPVIDADDIAAMLPVMLGSGVNLYGTYMFQGGENPDGKLSTLQESQATGYPTDVPIKSYDFQAPLSEFGEERNSLRKMKVVQYFLNDFGDYLAPMIVHPPDKVPASPEDFSVVRASVRSRGASGFIFVNNYVRSYDMPRRPATQFEVRLPSGTLRVPNHPVDIPSGAYFIWPFNLRIDGVTIRYTTAQLFTRLKSSKVNTLFFAAVQGMPVEFAFDNGGIRTVHASNGRSVRLSGTTYVTGIRPGIESSIDIVARDGRELRLVVLSPEEAEDAWKVRIRGSDHLLITRQDFFADSNGHSSQTWLRSRGTPKFDFEITPPLAVSLRATLPLIQTGSNSHLVHYAAEARERTPELQYRQVQVAGDAPAVKIGPTPSWRSAGVAQAPPEHDLAQAAKWSFTFPQVAMDGLSDLFLQVRYKGDVARLYRSRELLTDNFYNGEEWTIGLSRFLDRGSSSVLDLSILPLRKDAPIYLETFHNLEFPLNGQIDKLDDVRLVPEYQLVIDGVDR